MMKKITQKILMLCGTVFLILMTVFIVMDFIIPTTNTVRQFKTYQQMMDQAKPIAYAEFIPKNSINIREYFGISPSFYMLEFQLKDKKWLYKQWIFIKNKAIQADIKDLATWKKTPKEPLKLYISKNTYSCNYLLVDNTNYAWCFND